MAFFKNLKDKFNITSTCSDEQVIQELNLLLTSSISPLDDTSLKILDRMLQQKQPLVKGKTVPCKQSETQKKYIKYAKSLTDEYRRRLKTERDNIYEEFGGFTEEKKKLESRTRQLQDENDKIRQSSNELFKQLNNVEQQRDSLKKEASECKNKIQQLKPNIKIVGGIPRTKTETAYRELTSKQSPSPRTTKRMKEEEARRKLEGTPEHGALPIPRSSLWPKVKQNF